MLIFIFLFFGGLLPSVFSVDLTSAIKQSSQDVTPVSDIFNGSLFVEDLYKKTLHVVKQNETFATNQAIESVVSYFAGRACPISSKDVFHILYSTQSSFKTFVDYVVFSSLSTTWSLPTPASILASYDRFFACQGIAQASAANYIDVQQSLARLYFQFLTDSFSSSAFAQNHVGEELFWNGTLDDSEYDLLYDIATIGRLLFSSIQSPPEVLFYRLPTLASSPNSFVSSGGILVPSSIPNTPSPLSSSFSIGSSQGKAPASLGVNSSLPSTSLSPQSISSDKDTQQFLTTLTDSASSASVDSSYQFLIGNACADDQQLPPSQAQVGGATQEPSVYISGIVSFIENASSDMVLQESLGRVFLSDYQQLPPSLSSKEKTTMLSNSYAESLFGQPTPPAGSCESSCVSLVGEEYFSCQLACARSCIDSCTDLPLQDRVLCIADCSCSMVSGPQGSGWASLEDMFSIRFCKQPIASVTSPSRKSVSNLEGIYSSFFDVLQGLKSSGKTTRIKETKQFLDLGIDVNLSELLDFKIFVVFKPLFQGISDTTKKRNATFEQAALAQTMIGLPANQDQDSYDKYVVVADVEKNNAALQPEGFSSFVQTPSLVVDPSDSAAFFQQQKNTFLAEDVFEFLKSHIAFWDAMIVLHVSLLQDAMSLRARLEKN